LDRRQSHPCRQRRFDNHTFGARQCGADEQKLEGNAAKKGNQGATGPTHLRINSVSDKTRPARWLCRPAGRMERVGKYLGRQDGLDWRYCARNKLVNTSMAQEEDRLTRVIEARRCNKKRRHAFPARALTPYKAWKIHKIFLCCNRSI
jgi:hypothetical protein